MRMMRMAGKPLGTSPPLMYTSRYEGGKGVSRHALRVGGLLWGQGVPSLPLRSGTPRLPVLPTVCHRLPHTPLP